MNYISSNQGYIIYRIEKINGSNAVFVHLSQRPYIDENTIVFAIFDMKFNETSK